MDIQLIGATGYVGGRILTEALSRGHSVTALSRRPGRLPNHPRLDERPIDLEDKASVRNALRPGSQIISAYNPGVTGGVDAYKTFIQAAAAAGVGRLLIVGGAGSLEVSPGRRLLDEPDFPAQWLPGAKATARVLDDLRAEREVDWVFVSPAARLFPGDRTGSYRVGGDALLTDALGKSEISVEDFALAVLDEIETPQHSRTRYSVAY